MFRVFYVEYKGCGGTTFFVTDKISLQRQKIKEFKYEYEVSKRDIISGEWTGDVKPKDGVWVLYDKFYSEIDIYFTKPDSDTYEHYDVLTGRGEIKKFVKFNTSITF